MELGVGKVCEGVEDFKLKMEGNLFVWYGGELMRVWKEEDVNI